MVSRFGEMSTFSIFKSADRRAHTHIHLLLHKSNKMDYLASISKMTPPPREEHGPALFYSSEGSGKVPPTCPPPPPSQYWSGFGNGFIIAGLLFFSVGLVCGGYLISCLFKTVVKPCWQARRPLFQKRRVTVVEDAGVSGGEGGGCPSGPAVTATELGRVWGDEVNPDPAMAAATAALKRAVAATPGRAVRMVEKPPVKRAPPPPPIPPRPFTQAALSQVWGDDVMPSRARSADDAVGRLAVENDEMKNDCEEGAGEKNESPDTIENVKAKIQDKKEEVAQQEVGEAAASPLMVKKLIDDEGEGDESFLTALQDQ
jgi:hypothetical protein